MTIKETFKVLGFDTPFLAIFGGAVGLLILLGVAQIEQNNAVRRTCNKQTHTLEKLEDSLFPQVICLQRGGSVKLRESI